MVDKAKVLSDALTVLNHDDQPWEVTVEGDSLVARWKWMDARFFGIAEVTDETKEFTFRVTLDDKGKWHEEDSSKQKTANVDLKSGKISFGTSSFQGKSVGKSFTIGFGKDKTTGEVGVQKYSFDTKTIKEPIRNYLKQCGFKKAGFFG